MNDQERKHLLDEVRGQEKDVKELSKVKDDMLLLCAIIVEGGGHERGNKDNLALGGLG